MKKLVAAGVFCIVTLCMLMPPGVEVLARDHVLDRQIVIGFNIGRPKYNCQRGIWFCNIKVVVNPGMDVNMLSAKLLYHPDDGRITLKFLGELPDAVVKNGFFYAERGEEIRLPDAVCKKLRVSSVEVLPGRYKLDFSGDKYGSVTLNTRTE